MRIGTAAIPLTEREARNLPYIPGRLLSPSGRIFAVHTETEARSLLRLGWKEIDQNQSNAA
jgi:hypothetical protein